MQSQFFTFRLHTAFFAFQGLSWFSVLDYSGLCFLLTYIQHCHLPNEAGEGCWRDQLPLPVPSCLPLPSCKTVKCLFSQLHLLPVPSLPAPVLLFPIPIALWHIFFPGLSVNTPSIPESFSFLILYLSKLPKQGSREWLTLSYGSEKRGWFFLIVVLLIQLMGHRSNMLLFL